MRQFVAMLTLTQPKQRQYALVFTLTQMRGATFCHHFINRPLENRKNIYNLVQVVLSYGLPCLLYAYGLDPILLMPCYNVLILLSLHFILYEIDKFFLDLIDIWKVIWYDVPMPYWWEQSRPTQFLYSKARSSSLCYAVTLDNGD